MKSLTIILTALLLSGCAGLSINWDLAASYRSDVPLNSRNK